MENNLSPLLLVEVRFYAGSKINIYVSKYRTTLVFDHLSKENYDYLKSYLDNVHHLSTLQLVDLYDTYFPRVSSISRGHYNSFIKDFSY